MIFIKFYLMPSCYFRWQLACGQRSWQHATVASADSFGGDQHPHPAIIHHVDGRDDLVAHGFRVPRVNTYFIYMAWMVIIIPGMFAQLRGRDDASAALAFAMLKRV
jgi:hypothetical protein